MSKPKLSIDGLIEHMELRGITFNLVSQEHAKEYLENNNNYFKLTSYRKNFEKNLEGQYKHKYISLDFAYLQDLAIIDMRLRYALLHMCLDIEHFSKVRLMKELEKSASDGYDIVKSFIAAQSDNQRMILDDEIGRNKNNPYCGDLCNKHSDNFPACFLKDIIDTWFPKTYNDIT